MEEIPGWVTIVEDNIVHERHHWVGLNGHQVRTSMGLLVDIFSDTGDAGDRLKLGQGSLAGVCIKSVGISRKEHRGATKSKFQSTCQETTDTSRLESNSSSFCEQFQAKRIIICRTQP